MDGVARGVAVSVLFLVLLSALSCQRAFLPPLPADWESSADARDLQAASASGEPARTLGNEDAARRLLESLERALVEEDEGAVFSLLSSETRLLLDRWHPDGAERAISDRRVYWERRWWSLSLSDWLLGEESVSALRALGPTESSSVGSRRAEFSSESAERVVVVIREGDEWRLHRTTIPLAYLEELP